MLSCKSVKTTKNEAFIKLGSTKFEPTWDQMYTRDLTHYTFAISYWKEYLSAEYVSHFPLELKEKNAHSFFFNPAIMQGGSHIELKIQFEKRNEAEDFFYEHSKNFKVEKQYHDSLKYGWYCLNDFFITDTAYQFKEIDLIRLINPTWCLGKGDRELGGITSSIYLDKKKKLVFCVATDGRL